jgi:hypothetical protein
LGTKNPRPCGFYGTLSRIRVNQSVIPNEAGNHPADSKYT